MSEQKRSRRRPLKTNIFFWIGLVVIIEVLLYSYYFYIPVTVNGQTFRLRKGSTVSEALQRAEAEVKPGNLMDVKGKIIRRGGGSPPQIRVNGKPRSLSYKLKGSETITARKGKDVREELIRKVLVIEPPTYFVGEGSFVTLARQGEPGEHLTLIGTISGRIFEHKMLKMPVPTILRRQNKCPNKIIALTFDDGPNGKYTPQILKILDQKKVKATFFVLGYAVRKKSGLVKQEVAQGNAVGNHSYSHRNLTRFKASQINNDLAATEGLIKGAANYRCVWFRPPGGRINTTLARVAKKRHYRIATWNIDPRDWLGHQRPSALCKYILAKAKPGAVVLMHDGGGNQSRTVQALPGIIDGLRAKGYALVTLDELAGIKH